MIMHRELASVSVQRSGQSTFAGLKSFILIAGMVWLWDLSSCLGWQQGGPAGSWLQDTQVRFLTLCKLHHMATSPLTVQKTMC